jgi:hypothetical protein
MRGLPLAGWQVAMVGQGQIFSRSPKWKITSFGLGKHMYRVHSRMDGFSIVFFIIDSFIFLKHICRVNQPDGEIV